MKIFIKTFGCKLNQAESDEIKNKILSNKWNIVSNAKEADICIVNACSVTGGAEQGNRQAIRKIKRQNTKCFIIATGCLREPIAEIDQCLKDKKKIIPFIKNNFNSCPGPEKEADPLNEIKNRAFIKIQTGCDNYCSYCVIPYFRGKPKSLSPKKIISMVKEKERCGYKEIVLTGVNICKYSRGGMGLAGLAKAILENTSVPRIRFGSLDPNLITDELISLFKDPRILPSAHLSLQSGSDSVLKRMNRKYTAGQYAAILKKFKRISPIFSFTTDIIVGFPGETEKEFEETCRLIKKAGFLKVHAFPFSARPYTPARDMKGQVGDKIKKERMKRLKEIAEEERSKFIKKMGPRKFKVLIEQKRGEYWEGFTENYIRAKLRSPKNIKNEIIITGLS